MFFMIRWYEQLREVRRCESCETLREQLTISNAERQQLLKAILDANKPVLAIQPIANEPVLPQPILPKVVSWKVKREMLEAEDRRKAELMRAKEREVEASKQTTEELEQELGINNASNG